MRDFQQQSRVRAFFASRMVLSILLFLLLGMGLISFWALEAGWSAQAERAAVKERLHELEEKRDVLTSELEELRSQEGVEREARQKLNFRKPGEEVVLIKDTNVEHLSEEKVEAGLFVRFMRWIGIR